AGVAQDLEAVARPEHDATARSELRQHFHDGRASRDRAGAQVIAVGEPAGQDHAIEIVERTVAVPDVADGLVEHFGDDVMEVAVAPRPGEHDHAELHDVLYLLSTYDAEAKGMRRLILPPRPAPRQPAQRPRPA